MRDDKQNYIKFWYKSLAHYIFFNTFAHE